MREVGRIYFCLRIRAERSRLKGVRLKRWGCDSGGSEGRGVFLEQMTIPIRAGDRELCPLAETQTVPLFGIQIINLSVSNEQKEYFLLDSGSKFPWPISQKYQTFEWIHLHYKYYIRL